MNKSLLKVLSLLLSVLSLFSQAEDQISNTEAGFLMSGGFFAASRSGDSSNSSCSSSGYSGQIIEIGYDFNNIVGIETNYATADANNCHLTVSYVGLNIGHDFNTEWFRLYGKLGYAHVKEDETIDTSSCSNHGCYYSGSLSDSGVTFGLGSRFTFSGEASGLYLKIESTVVDFQNNNIGVTLVVGLGYRF